MCACINNMQTILTNEVPTTSHHKLCIVAVTHTVHKQEVQPPPHPPNHFSFSLVNFWRRSNLRFNALASCRNLVSSEGSKVLLRIRVTADVLMPNPSASFVTVQVSGCPLCKVFRWSIWSRDSLFIGFHASWPYLASFLRFLQSVEALSNSALSSISLAPPV